MKIPQKMYSELRIYDTLDLEKYLKALLDEINSRSGYKEQQIELIYTRDAQRNVINAEKILKSRSLQLRMT